MAGGNHHAAVSLEVFGHDRHTGCCDDSQAGDSAAYGDQPSRSGHFNHLSRGATITPEHHVGLGYIIFEPLAKGRGISCRNRGR